MKSLQEQLLQAGLADKKKARQVAQDKRQQTKQKRHNRKHRIVTEDPLKQEIEQARAEKLANDQKLAEQQKAERQHKELRERIRQILEHHALSNYGGDLSYNFTYNKLIKRLDVNEQIHRNLVRGTLAICVLDDRFFLIPEVIASRLAMLDPAVIAVLNDKPASDEVDEEDPYADYVIPDDLMW